MPITFEEAPFESDFDLKTTPIKQADGSIYTFRELPVVEFNVRVNKGDTAGIAAQSAVTAYGSQGFPGVYGLTQEGNRIRVFPMEIRASAGNMRSVKPIMNYPVFFPFATRGSVETLQLITRILSAESGKHVVSLNVPFHLSDTLSAGADGESASAVIERMEKIYNVPFSYQCLYEATTKTYYLNVEGVSAPNPPGVPARHGFIRKLPEDGPANSPWFTK